MFLNLFWFIFYLKGKYLMCLNKWNELVDVIESDGYMYVYGY